MPSKPNKYLFWDRQYPNHQSPNWGEKANLDFGTKNTDTQPKLIKVNTQKKKNPSTNSR